ncbi:hypothetical protein [Pseudomonas sp. 008]|jgi:hypothetical protein|uniref:hypothetical protein n=1 Tax=Pseudomonas sp. 008 TaxID=2803906 RepID=UPI00194FF860|nr:hypothetical protein [Pseudomonas sp. 008]GID03071.1 hypothetical protein TMM008_02730 [Pseudomonas sp. 008]
MNTVELKALNELLENECGWRVEIGVSPAGGEEFFRIYEGLPDEAKPNPERSPGTFVGVMPICTTFGAFVSSGALCQYYYQKGLNAHDDAKSELSGSA